MRLMIVDDEAPARTRLVRLVEDLGGYEVVAQCANGLDALDRFAELTPDVVLLDIRMPRMDGLETARHLAGLEAPPAVIFTTAFDEYALAAFDANAVGYLLKPVRSDRLREALVRAARPTRAQLGRMPAPSARRHLSARVRDRLELVPVESVRCLVADCKYVVARHAGGELLITDTLKELEEEFPERFLRVHRNALVAVAHLERLEAGADGAHLYLRNDPRPVEVSRRHLPDLRRRLRGK